MVLYTDRHHPPLDNDPQVTVVWLDAPDTAQQQIFGNLALEPDKAGSQAKVLPQSPNWARQPGADRRCLAGRTEGLATGHSQGARRGV